MKLVWRRRLQRRLPKFGLLCNRVCEVHCSPGSPVQVCQASGSVTIAPFCQEDGLTIAMSRQQESAPLMLLKMDNCEPIECSLGSGWYCENVDGDSYPNIDLSKDVWVLDHEDGARIVIANVKCSFDAVAPTPKITKKTGRGRSFVLEREEKKWRGNWKIIMFPRLFWREEKRREKEIMPNSPS